MPPASPRRWACRRRSRARPWLFLRPVQPRPRKSPAPPACCWPASWRPFRLKPSTGWGGRGEPAGRGQDLRRQGAAVQPSCDRPYRAGRGRVVLGRAGAGRCAAADGRVLPGPLTLILKRAPHIADTVSGRQDSIGLRCPSHPVAQALLAAFAAGKPNGQGGVAAPSANKFGQVSPTLAEHVRAEFPDEVTAGMPVLEGGASEVGIESTILTCRGWTRAPVPCCCVPAMSAPRRSRRCWARRCSRPTRRAPRLGHAQGALRAAHRAGTGRRRARGRRPARHRPASGQVALVSFDPAPASTDARVQWRQVPSDPARYAQALYACCASWTPRAMPASSQAPPANDAWHAVNDRIGRAAAAFTLDTSDL